MQSASSSSESPTCDRQPESPTCDRQSGIADLQSASSSPLRSPAGIANLRSPTGIANLGSPICNRPLPLQNRQPESPIWDRRFAIGLFLPAIAN
ncbi:MAG: hypothetical protein ACO331_02030 [Prochlorothrix sp.]